MHSATCDCVVLVFLNVVFVDHIKHVSHNGLP